jgi:hypothetical protein
MRIAKMSAKKMREVLTDLARIARCEKNDKYSSPWDAVEDFTKVMVQFDDVHDEFDEEHDAG